MHIIIMYVYMQTHLEARSDDEKEPDHELQESDDFLDISVKCCKTSTM